MLKPIAAVSLLLTAFISAALSQTSSTTAKSEFQVAAYTRVRVAKPSASVAAVENQTFELINKLRIDAGLEPLAWRNDLADLARMHSQDMAESNNFNHRGS